MSANRILTKRRRRTETDSVSVFRSRFAERQTRNSKREKCRLSLEKVLKQYRSSNRSKNRNKSSDNEIAVPLKTSRSTDVSSLDACSYENFVAGKYSTETPECNDKALLSDVDHLLSRESEVDYLTVENTSVLHESDANNERGSEQCAKEDFNSNVLPLSNADKGEYLPNKDGADLNVDNNSVENSSVLEFKRRQQQCFGWY